MYEQFVSLEFCFFAWDTTHIQTQHDILNDGTPRQEKWLLRHISSFPSARSLSITINGNYTFAGLIHPRNDIKKCTLATTTWSDDRHKFTVIDDQVDRCKGIQGLSSIAKDLDRKSTRLNSSHLGISYAVFCL